MAMDDTDLHDTVQAETEPADLELEDIGIADTDPDDLAMDDAVTDDPDKSDAGSHDTARSDNTSMAHGIRVLEHLTYGVNGNIAGTISLQGRAN